MVDEGASDRYALLLPARELVRVAVDLALQADQAEDFGNLAPDVASTAASHLQRVGDVVVDAAVGEQLEVLEHGADPPAQMGKAAVRQAVDVAAGDPHLAARRLHLADQHLDQRRLAAAGGPHDEGELAPLEREGDALHPDVAARIDDGGVAQLDNRRSRFGAV